MLFKAGDVVNFNVYAVEIYHYTIYLYTYCLISHTTFSSMQLLLQYFSVTQLGGFSSW